MGMRFNRFLIGYFFGLHLIYYMPQKQFKNFQQKVMYPYDKEVNKPDVDYFDLMKIVGSGSLLFVIEEGGAFFEKILGLIDNKKK